MNTELLRPASAREEIKRLRALIYEEEYKSVNEEYCGVLDEAKELGPDFVRRLEDAVGDLLNLNERQTLDRLVIGLIDCENVEVRELRTIRRSDYVPSFDHLTPNAADADDANYWEDQARAGR